MTTDQEIEREEDLVRRSNDLDEAVVATAAALPNRTTLIGLAIGASVAFALMGVAMIAMFVELRGLSASNNRLLEAQIPSLETTIDRRDATIKSKDQQIDALTFIVNKQAVPAIVWLSGRVEALGGGSPRILLGPDQPPFKAPSTP